ncbi:MAG: hypothetical protein JWP37_4066 [Mucilaginibacter sp.]|nr:hypothetical protein [Mucilaginibacter sp.]
MKKRRFIEKWVVLYFLLVTSSLFAQQRAGSGKYRADKDTLSAIVHQQDSMIRNFKELQNEMLAEKVFESSKSRLIEWITFGGIAGLGLILFGFFQVKTYFKNLKTNAQQKIIETSQQLLDDLRAQMNKTITEQLATLKIEQIAEQITERGNLSLEKILSENKTHFDSFVNIKKKEVDQLIEDLIRRKKESDEVLSQPLNVNQTLGEKKKTVKTLLATKDYSIQMLQILNQGSEGSSVGCAVAASVEFQIVKHLDKKIRISPRYIYNYARKLNNLLKTDSGTTVKSAIDIVRKYGAVAEKDWPYKAGEYNVDLPAKLDKADHYQINNSFQVKSVAKIIEAMDAHGPVVIGITVYESFMSAKPAATGIIPMPKEKESVMGGHAVCLVGYDNTAKTFKFRNSWGANWGDKGYGHLSFEYIDKFSTDAWVFEGVSVVKPA